VRNEGSLKKSSITKTPMLRQCSRRLLVSRSLPLCTSSCRRALSMQQSSQPVNRSIGSPPENDPAGGRLPIMHKREELRALSFDEFMDTRVPLYVPTAVKLQDDTDFGKFAKVLGYKFIFDQAFDSDAFRQGAIKAKEYVIQRFNKADYLNLQDCVGERFYDACKETHLLASSVGGVVNYEIKEVTDAKILRVGRGKTMVYDNPTNTGSGALAQSTMTRVLWVDVAIQSTERFQLLLQDTSMVIDPEVPKEELLFKEMEEWQDTEVVWRFEKELEDPNAPWLIVDIL
jgi:hypothetical protein